MEAVQETQTRTWEEEHAELHAIVDYMETKPYLTPAEDTRLKEIKKCRLYAKDRLQEMGVL